MIEYIIILIIAAVLLCAAVVGCSKPGAGDLCEYDRKDDEK